MSTQISPVVPVALFGSALLSGMIAACSIIAVPAIALAPIDLLVKQWQNVYHRGRSLAPPFAICSAVSFAFLAYQSRNNPGRFAISPSALYGAAAILTPSIVPYTIIVMSDTLTKLEARADGKSNAPSDAEVRTLVRKWTGMNMNRAYIVGAGALLGCFATLAA